MTTTTNPVERRRLETLARKLYAQGAAAAKVAAITGLAVDDVEAILSTPAPVAPSRPVPVAPALAVAVARPIGSPRTEEPRVEDRSVEALLRRAQQTNGTLGKKAERLREQIAQMWTAVDEHDAKASQRHEAEQQQERARIAVEEAKRVLAQAVQMAKDAGLKVGLKSTTSGNRSPNRYSDEGRASMRANGLKLAHRRGNHASKPNAECPTCSEIAGGGV